MQSKFIKSANKRKKETPFKNSVWVSINAEFHADFESIEKVLKNAPKNSYKQKYSLFSLLLMFVKLVLLIILFW
jgi:hypothetical protein